jgi:ribonuclease HII
VNQTSLADIKRHYVLEGRSLDAATEAALRADPRPGAGAILQAIARRRFENRAEGQRLRKWALWDKGILHVAGVDEAGLSRWLAQCQLLP